MEKNDYKKKMFILLALAISVLGLSIGFAAFSQTLTINSAADVTPENTFTSNVNFSGTPSCDKITGGAEVVDVGTLSTENTVWEGLEVKLKAPGDSITCTVTVSNGSVYDAYLKEISFSETLSCKSSGQSSSSGDEDINADKICGENGVSATVTAGANSASVTGQKFTNKTEITSNNVISSKTTGTIEFEVKYSDDGGYVDNDVTVTIPELSLIYKSAN